ncbi:ATP-grasp domain-containing protein [Vibrio hyugaensis]|uniref:ATP-grasp domain-containing protein n=1 Tax=Vibrio hyugaensis TaxID=1534743 RepID=UPI000CE564FC|nr:ATP-grasp domain-containing protein [Vibrio hyugaensis]
MKVISINTAKRHNALSVEFLKARKIIVCVKDGEFTELSNDVLKHAFKVLTFESPEALISTLVTLDILTTNDRVFSASEDFMYVAAQIRERFGLEGMTVIETAYFRDKCLMKEKALSAGVNVPRYGAYHSDISFSDIVQHVGLPFVLKPKDSAGAFGVYIVRNQHDYDLAIKTSDIGLGYEYEAFIEGKLYHVDLLVQNGDVCFQAACEYSFPNLDFQFGKPCLSLVLEESHELYQRLTKFAAFAVLSLGLRNGPSHIEIFVKKSGELVFLEAACRTPGAIVVPIYQAQFDMNMIEMALDIECGNDIAEIVKNESYCMGGIFPAKQGRVNKINTINLQSEFELNLGCKVGDYYDGVDSVKNLSGSIVVKGKNYAEVRSDFEALKALSLVE